MGNKLRIVGLLGGIASGKSSVAAAFAKLGAAVIDADRLAHEALAEAEVLDEIFTYFGSAVFTRDRSLDRKKMASLVFADPKKRQQLENIVHPRVRGKILQMLTECKRNPKIRMAVLDVPLLMEAGLIELCDVLIFVDAAQEERMQRAKKNRGWSAEEFLTREKNQGELAKKQEQADYIISNSDSQTDIDNSVQQVFNSIMQK